MEHYIIVSELKQRNNTLYGALYNRLLDAEQLKMPPKEGESQPPNLEALFIIKDFFSEMVVAKRLDNYYQ